MNGVSPRHPTSAGLRRRGAALAFALALVTGIVVPAASAAEPALRPVLFGGSERRLPDFADLVEQVTPAVVNITVVSRSSAEALPFPFDENDPFFEFFRRFGIPLPQIPGGRGEAPVQRGLGSGFIVSSDGYILTNAHVVGEGGEDAEVTVQLADGRKFPAKVVGADRRTDIAVVKIDANGLPTVKFGDPEKARVGQWVIAVGSPFGFEHTVTAGIISAKSRRLPDETYVPFIQTDVAVNPGNSGGPLFNMDGEVIGINSQIYSRSGGYMGIAFAIPSDVAQEVKDQLIAHGRVQRGKLGVVIQGMDEELAKSFGLDKPEGALVASVETDSPAGKAGIQPGDVIVGVDGQRIVDSADLPRIIGRRKPGETVRVELLRQGKRLEKRVTLAELEEETAQASPGKKPSGEPAAAGISVRALTAQEAKERGLAEGGVMVTRVTGPAALAGLRPGDVIVAVNQQPVRTPEEFRQAVNAAGNRFAVLVDRNGMRLFIAIRR
ncbi:DegQ family serine endoprotease [Tepidiphilus baoligensis]|uniref:DegQ family serine endoprotease n=1 Tax=Tepidiphilus baoligensis TaxID=2698687 RepID=UPI0015B50449|nr:DegQ family serine endoprotease [Tepidiphilus baoligensis]